MPTVTLDPNDPFSSAYRSTSGNSEANSLVSTPAQANLAAAPSLASLAEMNNRINALSQQKLNASRIPGGADLEALSSRNIQGLLEGNLPQDYLDSLRTGLAQRNAGGGFGVDNAGMNSAALRAMGLQKLNLQGQGETELAGAYARNPSAPLWDVSQAELTPENYTNYLNQKAQQAQAAADLEARRQMAAAQLADNSRQFGISSEQAAREAAQRNALAYSQLGENTRQFDVGQRGLTEREAAALAENQRQANQTNTYQYANLSSNQNQFTQNYALQQAQQRANELAQQQANQRAQQQYQLQLAQQQQSLKAYNDAQQAARYADKTNWGFDAQGNYAYGGQYYGGTKSPYTGNFTPSGGIKTYSF